MPPGSLINSILNQCKRRISLQKYHSNNARECSIGIIFRRSEWQKITLGWEEFRLLLSQVANFDLFSGLVEL